MTSRTILPAALSALIALGLFTSLAMADDLSVLNKKNGKSTPPAPPSEPSQPSQPSTPSVTLPPLRSWMSPDLTAAWAAGYLGQGVTMTFVDEYTGSDPFSGNFGLGTQNQLHGYWTREEAGMIAPSATIVSKNFSTTGSVVLAKKGLNVINLSYAMFATAGYSVNQIRWSNQESSIINFARNGSAVISKAAGNDSVAMGTRTSDGLQDYLGDALIGAQSAIFVGALSSNGTTSNPASLAWYSDYAGSNTQVQSHFLVVGVDDSKTGLAGTSFAAPIVTGYAAILGSKFKTATPTAITNQLLSTARKDTLLNYNAATYGMGEASLSRALAPSAIH